MAKEKSPFHLLLIENGIAADLLKTLLDGHEAAVKLVTDANAEEIKKLKTDYDSKIDSLKTAHTDKISELTTDHAAATSELEERLAELIAKVEQTERITLGTFTAKNKKTYKFQDGILEFKFARSGETVPSLFVTKEALEDKVLMEELISIGAGFIEEVKS